MQAAIDHSHPPVRTRSRLVPCINSAGKQDHLLVIDVERSETVHTNNRDEVFLRVGDETRKLTFLQRRELLYDKGQSTYEATAVAGTSCADLREGILQRYADALGHPDKSRLLTARGFATEAGELTVAGVLLFGD